VRKACKCGAAGNQFFAAGITARRYVREEGIKCRHALSPLYARSAIARSIAIAGRLSSVSQRVSARARCSAAGMARQAGQW